MQFLNSSFQELKSQIAKMSPTDCCIKQPMKTSDGQTTMVCHSDCQWLKLEGLIANLDVEIEMLPDLINGMRADAAK